MRKTSILLGKIVLGVSRLRGGGSALPGLVVEKLDSSFLNDALNQLPYGVIAISGTNGKTTTTKMITELLESQKLKVFTNKSGSNFTRGVVSEIIARTKGFAFDYDIAVIELDEAHAVKFVDQVKPDYTLLLNVLPDQADRFGKIEHTAKLLTQIAKKTNKLIVLNREDPLIASIAYSIPRSKKVVYFGYNDKLAKYFPSDSKLHDGKKAPAKLSKKPMVELESFNKKKVTFSINEKSYSTGMSISGFYNYFNAAGALTMVLSIFKDAKVRELLDVLSKIKPASGRGEVVNINGTQVELVLVKNAVGFQLSLKSHYDPAANIMMAINDQYADGRDISWLEDVDFSEIKNVFVVSGSRAIDTASQLQKTGVKVKKIESDSKKALLAFLDKPGSKQIFANYTAMVQIQKNLKKINKS